MTKKKAITHTEIEDRQHAEKLLRAELQRSDPTTGRLDRAFTQEEIGAVIGLRKNTVNDIERKAKAKLRAGLAMELGADPFIVSDKLADKVLVMLNLQMARDRQRDAYITAVHDAGRPMHVMMFIDDLKRMQKQCGTVDTLVELREQLDSYEHDDWIKDTLREFVSELEAEVTKVDVFKIVESTEFKRWLWVSLDVVLRSEGPAAAARRLGEMLRGRELNEAWMVEYFDLLTRSLERELAEREQKSERSGDEQEHR